MRIVLSHCTDIWLIHLTLISTLNWAYFWYLIWAGKAKKVLWTDLDMTAQWPTIPPVCYVAHMLNCTASFGPYYTELKELYHCSTRKWKKPCMLLEPYWKAKEHQAARREAGTLTAFSTFFSCRLSGLGVIWYRNIFICFRNITGPFVYCSLSKHWFLLSCVRIKSRMKRI